MFVSIRAKQLSFEGTKVWVLCPTDGTGEIVAFLDGAYVAVNATSRDWVKYGGLWVVAGQQVVPVSDSGTPNNVPKRFKILERKVDAIIETGTQICPLGSPAGEVAWQALQASVQHYEINARRLGVAIP